MASINIQNYSGQIEVSETNRMSFSAFETSVSVKEVAPTDKVVFKLYFGIGGSINQKLELEKLCGTSEGIVKLELTNLVGSNESIISPTTNWDAVSVSAMIVSNSVQIANTGGPNSNKVSSSFNLQSDTTYSVDNLKGVVDKSINNIKMKQKNFFQSAVGTILKFGKGNGLFAWVDGQFKALAPGGVALENVAIADGVADEDAVTLKQLREKIAEMAKKGAVVVADLSTSPNPAQENEIRISGALEFTRIVAGAPEVFIPADGTVISVAKELVIDAGLIKGNAEETVLKADHIYIYDAPTNQLFDNGSIGDAYDETHVSKKMPIVIDASGNATGVLPVPANAHVVGLEVIVSEAYDGTPNGLKVQYAGADLVDFSELDLSEVAKMPVPTYAKEADATTPVVTGAIDTGSQGKAVVLLEYVMA